MNKNFPSILHLELINEPFAGDIIKNPLLLIPGVADRWNLQPFYDILNDAIRKDAGDKDHLVFFEPVTWDEAFWGVGFTAPPGFPPSYTSCIDSVRKWE